MGKGENGGNQHFLLFHHFFFPKAFCSKVVKNFGLCDKGSGNGRNCVSCDEG